MKITLEQKKEIIKRAKKELGEWDFLCIALRVAIEKVFDVNIGINETKREIRKIFPRFTNRNACKYFRAVNECKWWDLDNRKVRLQFLDFILTGKLPKGAKKCLNH